MSLTRTCAGFTLLVAFPLVGFGQTATVGGTVKSVSADGTQVTVAIGSGTSATTERFRVTATTSILLNDKGVKSGELKPGMRIAVSYDKTTKQASRIRATAVADLAADDKPAPGAEKKAAAPSTPAAVARAFLEAEKKGDSKATLALLTETAREKSGGKFTNDAVGPTARYQIGATTTDGDTARVQVNLTESGVTLPVQIRLRRDAGQWRIHALALFAVGGEEGLTLDFENPNAEFKFELGVGADSPDSARPKGKPGAAKGQTFPPPFGEFGQAKVEPGKVTLESPGTHGGFFGFAFSPDGNTLAGGTGVIKTEVNGVWKSAGGGEVVLWNSRTGKRTKTLGSHGATVDWLMYSNDGKSLVSASKDNGAIKVWEMPTGSARRTLEVPGGKMSAVGFAADGKTVVAVAEKSRPFEKTTIKEGGELVAWDAVTGAKKWSLPDSFVHELALSPDGKTLATYSSKAANPQVDKDGAATWQWIEPRFTFFDADTGTVSSQFEPKTYVNIRFLAFLPGTKRLAVLGMHGLSQFDIRTGEVMSTFKWDTERWAFSSLALSSDGKTVARAWTDWVERVDVTTGKVEGFRKVEFPNTWFNVVFSPDLKRIACTQQGAAIIDIDKLDPPPAAPTNTSTSTPAASLLSTTGAKPATSSAASTRPTAGTATATPKTKSGPGKENLAAKAKYSASSEFHGDPTLVAAKAFDGSTATRWHSKDGSAVGAWLAAQWEAPVTIHKVEVHEAWDRITDFTIQRFDAAKNDWVDLIHVFANRHLSSYSREGGPTGWGYAPDHVHVDGRRLEDHKDRVFGNSLYGDVHPRFTINLPEPLVTTGVRCVIKGTKHPSVSIHEMSAY